MPPPLTGVGRYGMLRANGDDGNEYARSEEQRAWRWCEPGTADGRKILPELRAERGRLAASKLRRCGPR